MISGALVVVLLAAVASALAAAIAGQRFHALVARDIVELFSGTSTEVGPSELAARWDSLPGPVRCHLRYAIPDRAPAIRTARLKHGGYFRVKPNQRWLPVRGRQYFTVSRPGFVWNASVRLAPLVWIEARDRLLSGGGNMLVRFCSAFTMADASGAEIDQGARLRWLAEMAWFPYGFVGDSIRWEAIDERSVRATLIQDGVPVSAVFETDEEGKFARLSGERYRAVGGGKPVLTPWIGVYRDYRDFSGLRVPSSVEVMWVLEDGEFSYVRFGVTALEYNVPHRFSSVSGKSLDSEC